MLGEMADFDNLTYERILKIIGEGAFHDLVASAVLGQNREAAVHALMTDPLTAAVCSLEEATVCTLCVACSEDWFT